ncbi:hypothetical protein N7490_006769 [Penicillium lividum]|nr:hypothetical protein N7490_006769 [Penicillium lividum]
MATTISYDSINSGFQAGVIHGNVGNITVVQSETLNQACLRDLRTTNPLDDKERIKNTKGGLLKDSYRWILDNKEFKQWQERQKNRLLWIKGDPGKGKTMLLCGIIEELTQLYGDNANISVFFCQATDMRINSATSILRGLIYLLVEKHPSLLPHVRARYDHAGKALFEDVNAWSALLTIFTDILKDPTLPKTYLVIDALDECTNGLDSLLDLIVHESSVNQQIKWVVSSRNWPEITERLEIATHLCPISLELNEASVSEAVNQFIQQKVRELAKAKNYSEKTRSAVQHYLLSNSQGTFLWVALVCQNLEKIRTHVLRKLELFPPGLNALYSRMIDQVRKSEDSEVCKELLAIISTVFRPITLSELASLIELPDSDYDNHTVLEEIIGLCGSFLTLREQIIVFVHQSAKEFLLREALDDILPRGIEAGHHMIFSRSLEVIIKTVRRDIFDIKFAGFPIKDVKKPSLNPLAAAEYACVYWVDHLRESEWNKTHGLSHNDIYRVDVFLQLKYLNWLEALSILGSVSYGIQAMQKLEMLIQEKENSQAIFVRARDASRFIRYFRAAIQSSPLQVYYSPLIFSPTESLTRKCFQKERPDWICNEPVVEDCWSFCLHTLEGHTSAVESIAWSPDGSRLASASSDTTVRIWDPSTGQSVSTLEGHSGSVGLITWSPDGSQLASASSDILAPESCDIIVRIWDPSTGQSVCNLEGHSDMVTSIAWSPDGNQLASASSDTTVRIWDPVTGQSMSTLKGHSGSVGSITWSPDGSRLASASSYILISASVDTTVKIWDPSTGQGISTLKGHRGSVGSITWSPDGSRLASASDDKTVRIWDPATGQSISTLEGHTRTVMSIAWSPDESRLASASFDKTVRIWDPATGQSVWALEGHGNWVRSIAWSPDGSRLAASDDKTVRIWDLATGQSISTLEGHTNAVMSIAWSPDESRLASASYDKTVRIWDPATSQSMSTIEGHSGPVMSIAWSPDGSRLASASLDILSSVSFDRTIRIWDPVTGQSVSTLEGHSGSVGSITWSPDGSRLASASSDTTVRIWDPSTGQSMSTLKGHSGSVGSITWSPDGSRLASASLDILSSVSFDRTIRIWDPVTGKSVSTLEGHSDSVRSITWSPDGSRLASASDDKTVRIWDLATGQSVWTLHINLPHFLQFDQVNCNHLHTSTGTFDIGSIGSITSTPHGSIPSPEQYAYGLGDDSSWITYNGVNLLWLPVEYRPTHPSRFAMSARNLAIGCSSGHVIFLAFTERGPVNSR